MMNVANDHISTNNHVTHCCSSPELAKAWLLVFWYHQKNKSGSFSFVCHALIHHTVVQMNFYYSKNVRILRLLSKVVEVQRLK